MEDFESLNFGLQLNDRIHPAVAKIISKIISKRGRVNSQELMRYSIKNFIQEREDETNFQSVSKKRYLTFEENNIFHFGYSENM